jgi:hypothetical protein
MKYLWLPAVFLPSSPSREQRDARSLLFASWRAPLVLVVLAAFAGGLVIGALGMLPGWGSI